jgi:DNA polymerase III alpha subunit (gram-positive type)
MNSSEVYIVTDIEADGPIPGPNSMLSFGSIAYLGHKTSVAEFTANLETLPLAASHPDTMAWWKTQPTAWQACRQDLEPPESAMRRYLKWLKDLPARPVFVAYGATFDFMFVYWYLIHFTGQSPFGNTALDIKTLALAVNGSLFSNISKEAMPSDWFDGLPHTHIALDDAREHGALFWNVLERIERQQKHPS